VLKNQIDNVVISLYHPTATSIALIVYSKDGSKKKRFPMNKSGEIWETTVIKENIPFIYAFEIDKSHIVADPYATEVVKTKDWKSPIVLPLLSKYDPEVLEKKQKPLIPKQELIIYEMHTRGFTNDPSSKVSNPGTFLGIIEKVDYLLELGINAIELLPSFLFDETDNPNKDPEGNALINFWGYSPINFFSPHPSYGTRKEFNQMVNALHDNGIEIILDVVFNHTGESEKHPNIHFTSIDRENYYLIKDGNNCNFSGCGNTFNCRSEIGQKMVIDSLIYWSNEMHVDGFRFDLASCLTRGLDEQTYDDLLVKIQNHPQLKDVKLIAEPWDCAGRYQLGYFKQYGFSEWNDQYRDAVRRFINNIDPSKEAFKRALLGTPDLFTPSQTVNFITAHDGFTLIDLLSYKDKHNEENGENSRDGANENLSNNYGAEGPTDDLAIRSLRIKQCKNFLFTLFLSKGIPMLLMGDEYGHSKEGNNNTYCLDNQKNYFLWDEMNQEIFSFVKKLIKLRKTFSKELVNPEEIQIDSDKAVVLLFNKQYLLAFNQTKDPLNIPIDGLFEVLINTEQNSHTKPTSLALSPFSSLFAKKLP